MRNERSIKRGLLILGAAAVTAGLGACSGNKIQKTTDAVTIEPYEQLNLAVRGSEAELLVENVGKGQIAMRIPTDETAIEPAQAYTIAIDGSVIVELYNASRVPTQVRYVGSGYQPVEISTLR
ncbi:MAG: hypothetical protein AAGB48_06445 [Planctomycetota bacterium]